MVSGALERTLDPGIVLQYELGVWKGVTVRGECELCSGRVTLTRFDGNVRSSNLSEYADDPNLKDLDDTYYPWTSVVWSPLEALSSPLKPCLIPRFRNTSDSNADTYHL